mmetsp:Transcript_44588/g.112827  ORF Transcript_44588/g.112827 Transcript_44588/m.112827 type:complete len:214 (-) Transcript_44588:28-669(-)
MPPCVRTGVQEGRCQAHRARHGRQGQRAAPAAQGGPLCAGGEGAGAAARAGPHQDGRGAVRLPARGRTAVPHAAGGAEDAAQDAPPGPRPRRGLLRRRGVLPHHRLRALLQVGAPGHHPLHPAELQRGADWPGGRGRRSGGCGRQAGAGAPMSPVYLPPLPVSGSCSCQSISTEKCSLFFFMNIAISSSHGSAFSQREHGRRILHTRRIFPAP